MHTGYGLYLALRCLPQGLHARDTLAQGQGADGGKHAVFRAGRGRGTSTAVKTTVGAWWQLRNPPNAKGPHPMHAGYGLYLTL